MTLPAQPKTTINIGVIEGGTSVNTIAEHASLLLDMRSEDQQTLEALAQRVDAAVRGTTLPADVQLSIDIVGNREGGSIPMTHPIVRMAAKRYKPSGYNLHGAAAAQTRTCR